MILAIINSLCQRAYSIRTRIKTHFSVCFYVIIYLVREHIPLEQGLRLCRKKGFIKLGFIVREHIPLEQGLRLIREVRNLGHHVFVREHIPLEQGLRLQFFLK